MKELSDEQLRVAVAEVMGWINQGRAKRVPALLFRWVNPATREVVDESALPNYPASLDACATFETTLVPDQRQTYIAHLIDIVHDDIATNRGIVFSTARQRCLAYLSTVAPERLKGE